MTHVFYSKEYQDFKNYCLWLAVDVGFSRGQISGRDAPELWRAVIKDGLLATRPDEAMLLLEPMRTRGLGANVDCPGLLIECRDEPWGARIFLKFLGSAFAYAPACLLTLEASLRQGVGRQGVEGFVTHIHAWKDGLWHDIGMPLSALHLQAWRSCPAVLAGYAPLQLTPVQTPCLLTLHTRSRWVWRKQGKLVSSPPDMVDVLNLVAQRVERFALSWGAADERAWHKAMVAAQHNAGQMRLVQHAWRRMNRQVGGHYPGHGHQGFLVYEGVVSEALLFCLYLGSFLHVGQQTAIGLGGYALDCLPLPVVGASASSRLQ